MAAFVLYFQSFRHQPRSIRHDIAFLAGTASGRALMRNQRAKAKGSAAPGAKARRGKASDSKGIERDVDIQNKLLSVLYVKRRQNISDPGIGNQELERLLGCPAEHLAFHFWYLREKGWIGRTESGMLAITVEGVDRANSEHHRATTNKLLTDQSHTG
jgi:hypothetical protein